MQKKSARVIGKIETHYHQGPSSLLPPLALLAPRSTKVVAEGLLAERPAAESIVEKRKKGNRQKKQAETLLAVQRVRVRLLGDGPLPVALRAIERARRCGDGQARFTRSLCANV